MACCEIVQGGKVIGHICRPDGEIVRVPHRRRKRVWCFECRKRLLHTLMMRDPGPESYYGPVFWWACERCHQDRTTFPGW